MPKLRRPDGRVVSVSEKGVQALLARGYEPVPPERTVYEPAEKTYVPKIDFPFAAGHIAPEGDLSKMSRRALNAKAVSVGVESPEKLPNKQAVIDAINATPED